MDEKEIISFLSKLSLEEVRFVRLLLAQNQYDLSERNALLSTGEMLIVESWFWDRYHEATNAKSRQTRLRHWFIFILLRYGALKLHEIFALTWANFSHDSSRIEIKGKAERTLYLPHSVARRIKAVFNPEFFSPNVANPLRCASPFLRHVFLQCTHECNLPKGSVNARNLRSSRALELRKLGIPSPVLSYFLGLRRDSTLSAPSLQELLQKYTQLETSLHTSARNVFMGRVVSVEPCGIMVRVRIKTAGGLLVTSLITDQSCNRLQIQKNSFLAASVKAPWISMDPVPDESQAKLCLKRENVFLGTVQGIRSDSLLTEVTSLLSDGTQTCALLTDSVPYKKGDSVLVSFKAVAVVLNKDVR